jgi:TatD DNase family protein
VYIDSHCHLDFAELAPALPELLARMREARVAGALCISVELATFPAVLALAEAHPNLWATVGVHPDYPDTLEPDVSLLVGLAASSPRIRAIGETGLDYYRLQGDLEWQRERFRTHIRAARIARLPLVIHTRSASRDTLAIMADEGAAEVGGVMHCFTEDWATAEAAIDMGFCISFSGIVTFKSAQALREVAARVPDDRLLIETDSPYLAPVPHRGRTNEPSFVPHVAAMLAQVRGTDAERIAELTTRNFQRTFRVPDEELAGARA